MLSTRGYSHSRRRKKPIQPGWARQEKCSKFEDAHAVGRASRFGIALKTYWIGKR